MGDFRYSDIVKVMASEDDVLDQAIQYLKAKYGEKGLKYRSVLDLGCGTGRLMPRFAALFSSVTGLEPDPDRCDEAMEQILDQDLENATALCMHLDDYIQEYPNQTFDVVVCSRVFEHMKHETACGILESLKRVIGPDSVCLFMTTFTTGRRNIYTPDEPDQPSVCLFSRPWMERFLLSCGLKTKQFRLMGEDGALYLCEPVEGTLLRASCGPETASGKVCFMHSYYLGSGAVTNTSGLRKLRDEEGEDTEEIRETFAYMESYLYEGDRIFPATRHYRRINLQCEKVPVIDPHLIVSFYPGPGIAQVSVCLGLEDIPCDSFVFLNHIECAEEAYFILDGEPCTIPQLCENVLKECGLEELYPGPAAIITELNRFGRCSDPLALQEGEERCLYGILTGDEAYLHVPKERIAACMADCWAERDFAKVIAFNGNYVILNFNRSEKYADCIDYQTPYADHYFGELDDYFTMDAPTAGVNHGLYFAVETGQVIRASADRLMDMSPLPAASHGFFVSDDLKRDQRIRSQMIQTLGDLDQAVRTEQGSLDAFVMRSLDIPQKAEEIRNALSLVESDLSLLYRSATNRTVTVLAVLGLIIAILQAVHG
ncbi:MAG: class I SAM-dependent methyltransferase [Firmicutes bacterium]|nr:class I SAM-dependent methyltransferase [Bacillota bacterium]